VTGRTEKETESNWPGATQTRPKNQNGSTKGRVWGGVKTQAKETSPDRGGQTGGHEHNSKNTLVRISQVKILQPTKFMVGFCFQISKCEEREAPTLAK